MYGTILKSLLLLIPIGKNVLAKRLGLERQWLHARSLAFAHPADGRRIEITSPYPEDLQHALAVLRAES